jgi:outer membrane protein assembly factor BamB
MRHALRGALSIGVGFGIAVVLTFGPAAAASPPTDWPQWAQNPQHQGFVNVVGQNLTRALTSIQYDPNVPAEQAASGGSLLAHYQAPLVHENDVFMEFKTGPFTDPDHWSSQTWHEKRFHWQDGALVQKWDFATDWKPEPNGPDNGQSSKQDHLGLGGWEPVFHAVLANGFVYVPAAGGTIVKLNQGDGSVASHINPFGGGLDAQIFVAGPLSSDDAGNVYYNALKLDATDPWGATGTDVPDSWLVKVAADDSAAKVSYKSLVSGDPTTCTTTYNTTTDVPWPPPSPAPMGACGSQRVGLNVAPAIAPDGTIYSVSRAHFRSRYSYLLAINPNLTPRWQASLRGHLNDGCGVTLPDDGGLIGCRIGAPLGVDPATGQSPAGRVVDQSSSSTSVAPDGSILFGSYSRYNYARGHLLKFSAAGQFQAAFDFGWDTTPAIFRHGATYSIVIKDNHYDANCCPGTQAPPPGPYYMTQLSPSLAPEWQFKSTAIVQPDNPNGFEWCINAPAIDANGTVYANSEDGNVYAIPQGHIGVFTTPQSKLFLKIAIGAAYTPVAIGSDGKVYTENDGFLFAIGQ